MKLRSLRVIAMPGFPRGGPVLEDLSGKMNILIGVNGSGKTTLARAVRWLLWPATADSNALRFLTAQTFDNRALEINQSHSSGQAALDLPPENHAHCFTMTSDELFDGNTSSFAELVKLKLSGQVSVDRLYQPLESIRHDQERLKSLREKYEKRRQELNEEHVKASALPELKALLAESDGARKRLDRLYRARERRELKALLLSMKDLENTKPADRDNARRLEPQLRELKNREAELGGLMEECGRKIRETRLDRQPVHAGEIFGTLEALVKAAEKADSLEEEEARILSVLSGVPADVDWKLLDSVLAAGMSHENQKARMRVLRGRLDEMDRQVERFNDETLKAGKSLLAKWLALKEQSSPLFPGAMVVLFAYFITRGDVVPAVVSIAAATGAFAVPVLRAGRVRKRYLDLQLDNPASWAVHDVLMVQESLAQAASALNRRRELQQELENLEGELGPSGERLAEMMESMGVSSSLGMEGVIFRMKRLPELDELRGRLGNARRLRGEHLEHLRELFHRSGEPLPDSVEAATWHVENLRRRMETYRIESENLGRLQGEMERVVETALTARKEFEEIFSRNLLAPGNIMALEERHSRYQDYQDARFRLKHLEDPDEEDFPDSVDLDEEIRGASELASSREQISHDVVLAQAAERKLEKSSELAEILSDIQRQEARIESKEAGNRRALIRRRLLDLVKREYQVEIQPWVVNRASQLLARFTSGRYGLSPVSLEDPEITARDSETGEDILLDHLSRGTRMQLLLALKIAFAEQAEGEATLPMVFDEVLANTDILRFREVAASMAELVKEGRQLFYLTCQEPDAALIGEVFEKEGQGPVRLIRIDMGEPAEWPGSEVPARIVPHPGEMDYDQYAAAISPPPVRSGMSSGQIHPAWILNDPQVLHRLLEANLDTVGKAVSAGRAVLDPRDFDGLATAAKVAEEVMSAFSRGKAVPLNRKILEESPVGRSKLFDDVWALSEKLNHHPEKLISALREKTIRGFHTSLMDELQTFLRKEGFVSSDEPISRDEAWVSVLNAGDGETDQMLPVFERLWHVLEKEARRMGCP